MNTILNKKAAAFAGGVVSMVCLVACGDDVTRITNVGVDSVAAYEDLSECTAKDEGALVYVKDKGNTYLCSDESWHSVKGEDGKNGTNGTNGNDGKNGTNGKNGENGTSCSAKATDGGIQVSCGGTVIGTLTNGKNGDNCSIAEVENGAEVTCGTSKVTIKNGTNGAAGSNGTNGTNGDDCAVSKTGGVATVVCGTNSVQISDGTNCSVVESDDGATITCGSNVVTVPKGAQGVAGKSAFDLAKEQDPSLTLAEWLASLKGDKGEDGTNCSVSKSGSVTTIDCGNGNTATISDGASGTNGKSAYELANTELTLEAWLASLKGANGSNGTNCSVSKSGSTTTIDCGGGNTATITDGAPGSSGSQGPKGDPGSSGSKGADGVGCSVQSDGNGGAIVICGASSSSVAILKGDKGDTGAPGSSGSKGDKGDTGESCSVVSDGNGGAYIKCGSSSSVAISKGDKGEPGSSGSKGDTGYGCKMVDDGSGTLSVKCGPDDNPTSTATIYKAVCGTTPYDPASKFCVGVTLYELCGGVAYDPTGYECVGGVVKAEVAMESCGSDEYNPKTHFCAKRDNVVERIYKKVIIGEGENAQTWMAENLDYETENSGCGGSAYTEGDCSIYGRLYTWAAAINNSTADDNGNIQGVCPDGWHLPSKTEFEKLITNVDADLNGSYNSTNKAGTALKSTSGWNENGNGSNASGFSALPAGNMQEVGSFFGAGDYAYFWCSTGNKDSACGMILFNGRKEAMLDNNFDEFNGFSVRCVQNDPQ
jgi:uncharacterized protein (TIGR02145 family)